MLAFGIFALISSSFYFSGDWQGPSDPPAGPLFPAPTAQSSSQIVEITALRLCSEYQADKESADSTYNGKVLNVSGIADRMDKDVQGEPYLALKGKNRHSEVRAFLHDSEIEKAARIKRGTKIMVRCVGDGLLAGSILLQNCIINEVAPVARKN